MKISNFKCLEIPFFFKPAKLLVSSKYYRKKPFTNLNLPIKVGNREKSSPLIRLCWYDAVCWPDIVRKTTTIDRNTMLFISSALIRWILSQNVRHSICVCVLFSVVRCWPFNVVFIVILFIISHEKMCVFIFNQFFNVTQSDKRFVAMLI